MCRDMLFQGTLAGESERSRDLGFGRARLREEAQSSPCGGFGGYELVQGSFG